MVILEEFKRRKQFSIQNGPTTGSKDSIFFKINFDSTGAYLEVKDKDGLDAEYDYRDYSGLLRNLTKSIQVAKSRNQFTIDWENPENRLYLHEHPYLIPQLTSSGQLINEEKDTISSSQGIAQLNLVLERTGKSTISGRLRLPFGNEIYDIFKYVNEQYVYVPKIKKIIESNPVGPMFATLQVFNEETIPEADLQKYLSIFYSNVDSAILKYENYTVKRSPDYLKAQPAVIFDKVDTDNSLYLRISQILPNIEPGFLDDYDLYQYASINEMEECITIHPIEQIFLEKNVSQIESILYKHLPKGKRKTLSGIIRESTLLIIPENIASAFIYKEIPSLIGEYVLIGSEKLKEYKINVHPPRLDVQLGHDIDFLEGSATLNFGDLSVTILDAINQYNKNRYILLSDGTHALVNEDYMKKLQRLFKTKKNDKEKVEISFFDLPLIEELIEEKTAKQQFGKAREIFEGFNKLGEKKIKSPDVKATLRPYQLQGFKWLKYLFENNLGGCLADDMGLGKTLQSITLLTDIYLKDKNAAPSLIVMPRSLVFNWENELTHFSPGLNFYTWYGQKRVIKEALDHHIILTTYPTLRNDIEQFKEINFHLIILDESQAAKNLNSQVHKSVMVLKSNHRLALSGTPVENNLSELYALFRFLNPGMFGSAENFNQNYLAPIQKHDNKTAMHELRKKIYPFVLRRLKKDVLKELPPKIEQTLYVEMSEPQAKYYEQRRLFYKEAIDQQIAMKGIHQSQFFIFQALNELRQLASIPESKTGNKIHSSKMELLLEQLEDAIANRHKILIFANYLLAVDLISEALDNLGVDFVTMTGSTRNRKEVVERFQNDPDCKAFILTLKTGGSGLNLTAADMVFIFDPWWNKAAENQAIDRAHRIGQDKKIMSYKLITLGTIEEKILRLQEKKSALFENIISTDSASLKSISEDDIAFMLGK